MKKLEKKTFPRTARDLAKMTEKATIKFDNVVQRHFCWKNTTKDNRMSMLIDTMLRAYPVPPFYCSCETDENGNKVYSLLDGLQRTTTIVKYLNDEFALVGLEPFEDEDGNEIDLNGKKFSELPQEFQDEIRTYSFTFYYYEDIDEEQLFELFSRMNNGKVLSAIEKTRSMAKSFYTIKKLAAHPIFETMLSSASIASYGNEDITIKAWIMLNSEKPCLDTKEVRPIMKDAEITPDQADEIKTIFDRISEVHNAILNNDTMEEKLKNKIAKRIYTKTHFVSIVPIIKKAIEDGRLNSEIANLFIRFYGSKACSINESYNLATGSGSGHEISVKKRNDALMEEYNKFFTSEIIEEDVVEDTTEVTEE